jgi:hypothetical protein
MEPAALQLMQPMVSAYESGRAAHDSTVSQYCAWSSQYLYMMLVLHKPLGQTFHSLASQRLPWSIKLTHLMASG